ncbi:MAG TPA: hypothetical protein VF621_13195 [Pyrinomonadaceae bacterium]|jgi:hypothetical protein
MTVTRRSFLRSGATAAFLAGLAFDKLPLALAQQLRKADPRHDFQVPAEVKQESTYYFKRETFQPYLNGVFTLRAGANSVEATLVTVRDCTPKADSKLTKKSRPSDCFALVFKTQAQLTDLTTIYDVEHGALGTFPLFLTRRDGPQKTFFYEAVFNRAL